MRLLSWYDQSPLPAYTRLPEEQLHTPASTSIQGATMFSFLSAAAAPAFNIVTVIFNIWSWGL